MKILPQGYRVYIKLLPVEEKKVGRIILPGKHAEQSRIGEVLAVGKDADPYEVGDKVLVQFYAGIDIHLVAEGILDDTHRIFTASEILAKVED